MTSRHLLAAAIVLGAAASASAQADGPDPSKVKVRIGALWVDPTIALTNIGVDKNVFNEPNQAAPKQDFTFTLSPNTALWLRMGPTWVSGTINEDIVWYQKYASERSGNTSYGVTWKVPLNRLSFSTGAKRTSTRARPGFEIDARAQRGETTYSGTAEVRLLSKTFVGATADYLRTNFDQNAVFLGTNLHDGLNRSNIATGLSIRHQLTPLTSLTFGGSRSEDRFEFSPLRNSTSTSVSGGVRFDPAALLKGGITVGYQNFTPADPSLPGYKGSTGAIDLAYTFAGITKISATGVRNVSYSFDITQPYYILTGISVSASQQLFGPLDVVARYGLQQMAYQDRGGVVVQSANRTDHVHTYGGGVGFYMGKDVRLGFNIDNSSRTSVLTTREYDGLHYGFAITYGS